MIVELTQPHSEHPSLSPGHRYLVIGIEANDYRLLNDWGHPCLYPPDLFTVVDRTEPSDWVSEIGDDGEHYAYPPALNATGFFDDFFDRQPEAMTVFWQTINQGLTAA